VRRVGNSFELTKQHREIWSHLFTRPDLKRILDPAADLKTTPVSADEKMFVNFLFLHLANAYRAKKNGLFRLPEELHLDIATFLSLPIPNAVWEMTKRFRNRDFIAFVERERIRPGQSQNNEE
jgi:hypothetical protein